MVGQGCVFPVHLLLLCVVVAYMYGNYHHIHGGIAVLIGFGIWAAICGTYIGIAQWREERQKRRRGD